MILKELLGAEAFDALPDEIKTKYSKSNFEDVSQGKFVPKDRLDDEIEKVKGYKKQIGTLETQLSDLKEDFKDAAGLKDKVETLEKLNSEQKIEFEKKLSERAFDSALEKALGDFKAKDAVSVMAHINRENLKLDADGKNVIGLKEQIESLQKTHDYLFEKEIAGTQTFGSGFKGGDKGSNSNTENNFATMLGKQKAQETSGKTAADFFAK